MLTVLDAAWSSRWIECDSEYKQDSIAGKLTDAAAARIYKYGIDFYIVNLRVASEEAGLAAEVAAGRERLIDGVLPLLSAREVKPTEPTDGM